MKIILKILIPVVIFFVTLWILVQVWNIFQPPTEDQYATKHEWIEVRPGSSEKLPAMAEIVKLPNTAFRHRITNKHGLVSDVVYKLNSFGIRDQIDIDRPKKSHLLFSGCSFTFGDNISYEESLPAIMREVLPEVNVRNLAFPGGGLHTALRHFEISDFREFVPEQKGIYIYVYIPDHFSRWTRDVSYLRWARALSPTYNSENGKIIYTGKLLDHPDYRRYHFFKSLGISLPDTGVFQMKKKFERDKMKSFMDGIVLLKERYLKKFPEGRFIWLFHPQIYYTSSVEKLIRASAQRRGVEVMFANSDYYQYLKTTGITEDSQKIRWDGHPNGEFNKWFAGWLKKVLFK